MKTYAVWIDSEKSHLFALNPGGVEKSLVSMEGKGHTDLYFRNLAETLKEADQVLLIGPGLAKNHFKDYLEKHHSHTLAKKVVGLENFEGFEHKSENQLLEKVHDFFKNYDVFAPAQG